MKAVGQRKKVVKSHPALANNVVLNHLFSFMDVDQLKICRMVCKTWLQNSEAQFRNQTRVSFNPVVDVVDCENRMTGIGSYYLGREFPKDLNKFFEKSTRNVTLTALSLHLDVPWRESELVTFFKGPGSTVTDLRMVSVLLANRFKILSYNLPRLLSLPVYGNLKVLCFKDFYGINNETTKFLVPIFQLHNLEDFCVHLPITIWLDGGKVNLKKLTITESLLFIRGREKIPVLEPVMLDEFINFDNIELIRLFNTGESLCLDMSVGNNVELVRADLFGTKIANWEKCNWKIEYLYISKLKLTEPNTKMIINKVKTCCSNTDANDIMLFLPPTIQWLKFGWTYCDVALETNTNSSSRFNFPKLKTIELIDTFIPFLPRFANCSNITDMVIIKGTHYLGEIDVTLIPKTVTKLNIVHSHPVSTVVSSEVRKLDYIIFSNDYNGLEVKSIKYTLPHFDPQTIIILTSSGYYCDMMEATLFVLIECPWKKIMIGRFNWKENDFKTSPLSIYVNKKATYYIFQNGKGMALRAKEFNKLLKLLPHAT